MKRIAAAIMIVSIVLSMFAVLTPKARATTSPVQTSMVVTANPLWTDAGMTVQTGENVSVTASGAWAWAYGDACGPDGTPGVTSYDVFIVGNRGLLIAFVGPDPTQGQWGNSSFFPQSVGYWAIGSNNSFTSNSTGELWLGINDDAVTEAINDNSGSLNATISVASGPQQSVTSVTCSPNPAPAGFAITCDATVTGSNPTGTITWMTNSSTGSFGSSSTLVTNGTSSTTYSDINLGTVNITATFSGDTNNLPSSGSTTLTIEALSSLSDNFSADSGLWTYVGSAYRNATGANVILTQPVDFTAGAIWLNDPVIADFTASFSYLAGGGSGADGIVMMFYKQENYTLANGGGLGFMDQDGSSVPGYGIEFDSYQNSYDPSGDHIALIQDTVSNHLVYVNDPRVADDLWHNVTVNVANSSVTCYLDSGLVLNWTGQLDRAFGGFGFAAATGLFNNWQMITNFSISYTSVETNRLNVNVVDSSSRAINGALVTAGSYICYSNPAGDAYLNLPVGTYNVTASSTNYQPASWILTLDEDKNITLTLATTYAFQGQIPDSNIILQPTNSGYNITLLNSLASSSMDIFFDWQYMGTISAGTWQSFSFNHLPNLIVEAASIGSSDYPNAWYAQPIPIPLNSTTAQTSAFLPEPLPYIAGSIFVNPYPPSFGQNTTIGVTLHNPYNYTLSLSRLDFQVSGLTVGGTDWTSVGFQSNITLSANETNVFTTTWIANVNGHHCVRVVSTYLTGQSMTLQRNLDVENGILQGQTGQVSFSISNPYQTDKNVTVKVIAQLPAGWETGIEINSQEYNISSDITINLPPGGQVNAVLSVDSSQGQAGQAVVDVEGYIDGQLIGGIQKTMETLPPTPTSISIAFSSNPAATNSSVTCTATVAGTDPTGTINWSSNSSTGHFSSLATSLVSGSSSTIYNDTSPGTVNITASYSGDTDNLPSIGNASLTLTMPANLYTVSFNESGLPQGILWTVVLASENASSTTNTIAFSMLNGSYSYYIGAPNGYTASPASGNVTVNGQTVAVEIVFTQSSQPQATNVIFEDNFYNDKELNAQLGATSGNYSVLWTLNSPMLSSIANYESSAFTEGTNVGNPNLPVSFSNNGMLWSMSGYNSFSGITSNIVFTPPYNIQFNASLSYFTGGNPLAIFLTNNDTSAFLAIFVGNSIYVQNGSTYPTDLSVVTSENTVYTFQINVTESSYQIAVLNAGQQIAQSSGDLNTVSNYGYYLTLGSFAGAFPGETLSGKTISTESNFNFVDVTSSQTWNLHVAVNDNSTHPLQNSQVVLTNLFRNVTYTNFTDSNGLAVFSNLVSGFYSIIASVSQGSTALTNQTMVSLGDLSNPAQTDLNCAIEIEIPTPDPLSISLAYSRLPVGLFPIVENFTAIAAGWMGNGSYTYTWDNNGTNENGDNAYQHLFDVPGSVSEINVTVTSSGSWFSQPETPETSTSDTVLVVVTNSPYLATLSSLSTNNYAPLSYDGVEDQAVLFIADGRVTVNCNVTDEAPVITLPQWLTLLVGVENAWHGIILSDFGGVNSNTGEIIQPGGDCTITNGTLPSDAPTGISGLTGYKFNVILDPDATWAWVSDLVTVVFGVIGVYGALSDLTPVIGEQALNKFFQDIVKSVFQAVAESITRLVINLQTNTKNLVGAISDWASDLLKSLVSIVTTTIPQWLLSLGISSLSSQIVSNVEDAVLANAAKTLAELNTVIGAAIPIGQLLIDLAAIASTIYTGPVSQEYQITNLQNMSTVSVTAHSPAPYVTIHDSEGTFGFNGDWVSSTPAFVTSDYTPDEYSFAFTDENSVKLFVQAPPGVNQTDYNITFYHDGLENTTSGVVTSGNPQEFIITYENDSINITPAAVAITFDKQGIGSDFTGPVVNIDGTNYTASDLPVSFLWNNGSTHTFTFQSPLIAEANAEQYVWTSTTGLSPMQSGYINVTTNGNIVGNYKIQYSVTISQTGVGSNFSHRVVAIDGVNYSASALPTSFWWNEGSSHSFAFQSPLTVTTNAEQYVWTNTTGLSSLENGSLNVTTSGSIIGNYETQFYLTMATSPSGTNNPTGAGWYDANTYASISTNQYTNVTPGCSRYNFTGWTTSNMAEITNPNSPSTTVLMDKAKTVTSGYVRQYNLNMSTNFGAVSPGSGWFNAGSNVTISATAPSAITGERYLGIGWVGIGSGSYSGLRNPAVAVNVTMKGPVWEFAMWSHQYLLTVKTNGLPSPSSTEISLGWFELGRASGALPFTMWITAGTLTGNISVDASVSRSLGIRYVFTSWSDGATTNSHSSILMNGPRTLTADYKTQYKITFSESGIGYSGTGCGGAGCQFTGAIVRIDRANYTLCALPMSFWWDTGSTHTFQFISPVTVNSVQYVWASTTGLSTLQSGSITVSGAGTVAGKYVAHAAQLAHCIDL